MIIKCPECSKEISDKAESCPSCGYPIMRKNSEQNRIDEYDEEEEEDAEERESKVSIASLVIFVLGVFLCLGNVSTGGLCFIVSFVLVVIAHFQKNTKCVCATIVFWIITIGFVLSIVIGIFSSNGKKKSSVELQNNEQESTATEKHGYIELKEQEPKQTAEPGQEEEPKNAEIRIDELEVYNENGISITVTGIKEEILRTTIYFSLSSTSEKDYSISAHSYYVNGCMAGNNKFASDVDIPSGKKAKIEVEIENSWLEKNNITEISELDFIFWAYYDNFKEWDTGIVNIKTNLFEDGDSYSPSGKEIYSDDVITVWESGDLFFTIFNKSDYNAGYTLEYCSVNGWSYDITKYTYNLYDEVIHRGSYSTFIIPIDEEFLNENGIDKIENIEFDIKLSDDYWNLKGKLWEHSTQKIYIDLRE